jgi:2-amino-4-hydroxy-6-hydroxymethyldihydropteridine diphosphokinase
MGSNIDPETNLRASADLLRKQWPSVRFSSVWQTKAMEVADQADFLNAVACFDTSEAPELIQEKLQSIEKALKKAPPFRFGPRTIDLDILLYGNHILPSKLTTQSSSLIIPHPRLHKRRFVLEPLIELGAGEMVHPVWQKPLQDYVKDVQKQKCMKTHQLL